jgi:hypothetical protein
MRLSSVCRVSAASSSQGSRSTLEWASTTIGIDSVVTASAEVVFGDDRLVVDAASSRRSRPWLGMSRRGRQLGDGVSAASSSQRSRPSLEA